MKLFSCARERDVGRFVVVVVLLSVSGSLFRAEAISEEVRSAPTLYAKYCAKCHKADGTGNKNLSTVTPDFTRPAWQRDRSDLQLRISIREGKGQAMPSFSDRLGDKEVEALAAHVRLFAPSDREERLKMQDTEFDARFHKLELELADLRREFWELHTGSKQKKPATGPAQDPER